MLLPMQSTDLCCSYSKKAADVLLCEVSALTKAIVGKSEHLSSLLGFLEQPPIGDCAGDLALAGHFCRLVLHLSNSHPQEMLDAFNGAEAFFTQILSKLSLDSFKEMLTPLLLSQDDDPLYLVTCWFWERPVIAEMLEILRTTEDMSMHSNVSDMLRELVEQRPEALTELSKPENIKALISLLETTDCDHKNSNTFHVLSGLVAQGTNGADEFDHVAPPAGADSSVAGVIAEAMEIMARLLNQVPDREIPMPSGVLRPILGKMRLSCVEFIALVMRAYKTGEAAVCLHSCMIEHGILPCVINLLFEHPWHNILHVHIDDIIQHCLYSTNDELRTALIDQGSLHERLTEVLQQCCAPKQAADDEDSKSEAEADAPSEPEAAPAAEEAASEEAAPAAEEEAAPEAALEDAPAPAKSIVSGAGNLGCVVGLAQALSEAAENHECLKSRLASEVAWAEAVSGLLLEELRKQTLELGRSEPLPEQYVGGDSSSEDEQHYIHHSSSDDDEDPFHGSGVQNRITDAFATSDTTFHDDSDAWNTQSINDSEWTTTNGWVASFSNEASSTGGAAFGSGDLSGNNEFSMVEDPWADQAPEEIETTTTQDNWGSGPAWEANFGAAEPSGETGLAWNSCFEQNPETVEGAMVDAGCEGSNEVPEEVPEEEVPGVQEAAPAAVEDGFDVPEEESAGDV
eukprot:TRINITY_DN2927_c0_g1_i2.p1 TRINITY_DN2927_c0_g1~~TRINITY_DN2927_c0_g1_i2.p1  ORF type:complete len:685 (-),score=202.61 TRINITY_DN2927_c0_g1_i2:128-2182(-)